MIAPDLMTGWTRPRWRDGIRPLLFNGAGVWFSTFGWQLLAASNSVVITYIGHPEWVAVYAVTAKLAMMCMQIAWVLPDSALVGLAQLFGERESARRVREVVALMLRLHLILAGGAACGLLAFNPAFVTRWVGGPMFGGLWLNALLVLGVVLYSFVHGLITSASVLGNRLHVGVVVLVNGVLQVGAAIAFGHRMGLNGVALAGLIVGLLTAVPAGMVLLKPVAALTTRGLLTELVQPWLVRIAPIAAASALVGAMYGRLGLWGSGTAAAAVVGAVSLAHASAVCRAAARSPMDAMADRAAPAAGAAGRGRGRPRGRRAALNVVPIDWQIVTGEYPPQTGGVSDYTRLVARGLADAGDRVEVWAPPSGGDDPRDPGVVVHRLPDRFGPWSLARLGQFLDARPQPRRLLVQYVPHAFGWKAANLPFCLWLRSRRRDGVWVMFHEVAFPREPGQRVAHRALGAITRRMAKLVAQSAARRFVAIPAWRPMLESIVGAKVDAAWLPVPSGIPVVVDADAVRTLRARYAGPSALVGHFGTYGDLIAPMLEAAVPALLAAADCRLLLLGHGSAAVQAALATRHPSLAERIAAAGSLSAADVSRHLQACDVMLQPYPDGVSSRRTSAMAALAHGRALVTTAGALTEPIWSEREAAALVPVGDSAALAAAAARLVGDPAERAALAAQGARLYDERFDLRHTIAALRAHD